MSLCKMLVEKGIWVDRKNTNSTYNYKVMKTYVRPRFEGTLHKRRKER